MAELKKCPFCGGEAYKYISGSVSNGVFAEVICKECYSRTDRMREDLAIEAWNKRVNEFDAEKYGETAKEIREKAIDDFVRWLKNHPHAQYHLDNYLLEDIDQTARWLKEESK